MKEQLTTRAQGFSPVITPRGHCFVAQPSIPNLFLDSLDSSKEKRHPFYLSFSSSNVGGVDYSKLYLSAGEVEPEYGFDVLAQRVLLFASELREDNHELLSVEESPFTYKLDGFAPPDEIYVPYREALLSAGFAHAGEYDIRLVYNLEKN